MNTKIITHMYVIPVNRKVNEAQLDKWLRENGYCFCLPDSFGPVIKEFNETDKPLGIIFREHMKERS